MATKWSDLKHESATREVLAEYTELERIGDGAMDFYRAEIKTPLSPDDQASL